MLISSFVGVSSRTTMDLELTVRGFALTHESVLAEKLETVVSRGVANTRPRDFYDIHVLLGVKRSDIDMGTLGNALASTCEKRSSQAAIARWAEVLDDVAGDAAMLAQWAKYVRKNPYAKGIALQDCCEAAKTVLAELTDIHS